MWTTAHIEYHRCTRTNYWTNNKSRNVCIHVFNSCGITYALGIVLKLEIWKLMYAYIYSIIIELIPSLDYNIKQNQKDQKIVRFHVLAQSLNKATRGETKWYRGQRRQCRRNR